MLAQGRQKKGTSTQEILRGQFIERTHLILAVVSVGLEKLSKS